MITFAYRGQNAGALARYAVTCGAGYLINLAALALLLDHVGIAHEFVQAGMIVVLPAFLFGVQRYRVFYSASQSGKPGQA